MHKSHQTRMTNLSNQLREEHNKEINLLLEEQDKQLQEQSNSSDMNKVDLQRKQMLELERNIHVIFIMLQLIYIRKKTLYRKLLIPFILFYFLFIHIYM